MTEEIERIEKYNLSNCGDDELCKINNALKDDISQKIDLFKSKYYVDLNENVNFLSIHSKIKPLTEIYEKKFVLSFLSLFSKYLKSKNYFINLLPEKKSIYREKIKIFNNYKNWFFDFISK